MISVLLLLGWIALIVGAVLLIIGYFASMPNRGYPHLVRPGWGLVIVGVVLLLLGYLLIPAFAGAGTEIDVDGMRALISL
jgi:predicted acyltransferase